MNTHAPKRAQQLMLALAIGVAFVYYACNPNFLYYDIIGGPGISILDRLGLKRMPCSWIHNSDYTFRIATALVHGRLGANEKPPGWVNEFIPVNGIYYSAFPLGSVLPVVPGAVLYEIRVLNSYPAGATAALIAGIITSLLFAISSSYALSTQKKAMFALSIPLGTFMWSNLATAGAWQLALGFAMIGELGALYYSIVKPRPLVCGSFFALAFGNRTEILLLAPLFVFLMYRRSDPSRWNKILRFCIVPIALGVATLVYNYARFGAITEFGYAKIPGVLKEPWYQHGLFSVHVIPLNFHEMLTTTWKRIESYPYLVPTGFGGSIFLNSPILLLAFRTCSRDVTLKLLSWIAIVVLTAVLWMHGNPGGWQFSYRYAMVLLPWFFILLLESSKPRLSKLEIALVVVSVAINAYATYLFLWTDYVRP